jgi:hypothetical protein
MRQINILTKSKIFINWITLLLISIVAFSFKVQQGKKGCSGKYYIKGVAYISKENPISNKEIKVTYGKKTNLINTDSKGNYEIEVNWTITCPSGLSKEEHNEKNNKLNPKYISITYNEISVQLENKWKNYANCLPQAKDDITWEKDLYFMK